ncbi:MAG: saccharopine dehydrogenase C-terminal domain-containing protein [Bacteroidota bacterium]
MRITVIGAGAIGSAIAFDLTRRPDVSRVRVCESRPGVLRQIREALPGDKTRCYQVDARDAQSLDSIVANSDLVISCVAPQFGPMLAELSIRNGAHFCELGGDEAIAQQLLAMGDAAQNRARWIVPNCGLAPGLINILCMRGIEYFDEVDSAVIRGGDVPVSPEPPFNYRLAHSADKLLSDYTHPATLIRDGQLTHVEPLTGLERTGFPEPFGELEGFYASGMLSTLPQDLQGRVRTLDAKLIRYPGHANAMRVLVGLGFADDRSIDVRTHLTYRDVLTRQIRKRLGGTYEDAVLVRIRIEGRQGDAWKRLTYEMVARYDEQTNLSAMRRCTAFATSTIATLIAAGAVPQEGGAAPPERLIPKDRFFDDLERRGLVVETHWEDIAPPR